MKDEEHPDVIRLSKVIEKNQEERDLLKRRDAYRRELDVNEEIPAEIFFCKKCVEDFRPRVVFKIEDADWNTGGFFRYWKARHRCGSWSKRFITQKIKDPFWSLSAKVRKDRSMNFKDIIQPEERGFNMLYGRKINRNNE